MLTQTELNKIYAEKLLETDSHDAAMLKLAWTSYQKGLADGDKNDTTNN